MRLGTRTLTVKFMPPKAGYLNDSKALDDHRKNGTADLSRDMETAWWQSTADYDVSRQTLIESFASHREALTRKFHQYVALSLSL